MAKASKHIPVSRGTLERMPRPLFGDSDNLFDDFLCRRWMRPFAWERPRVAPFIEAAAVPSVDVIDRDAEIVVRASVPGYRKEDIAISVSGSLLTIKGETKAEKKEEKGDYTRCEISRGAFTRAIMLPAEVDDAKARASMKDGLLELALPKRQKAKRRSISIP